MPKTNGRKCSLEFSRKLEELVESSGVTKSKLFEEAGIDANLYSRFLKGTQFVKLQEGLVMARALGVSLDYLADDSIVENPALEDKEMAELIGMIKSLNAIKPGLALRRLHGLGDDPGQGDWKELRQR